MTGLTQRQRVKINAALSIIHDHGFDPNGVVALARQYRTRGADMRSAYERALNEFIQAQPDLSDPLLKVTRLVQASNDQTVAQYDHALSTFIQTGDNSAIVALAPMIAEDSVALAVRNGEITGGVTPENVEAALGVPMTDQHVQAAAQAAPAQQPHRFAFNTSAPQAQPAPEAPMFGGGYISAKDQAKWAAAPSVAPGEPRGLLAGHTLGDTGINA